ncbi:hypothetical protein ACFVMC_11065 [Nocardia sp. NPDC127579]|uniref:hypothetical protein n=1 Tax=Nocardia sp. NPDC127579 TaxID=3345402 RepID=UPI003641A1DA
MTTQNEPTQKALPGRVLAREAADAPHLRKTAGVTSDPAWRIERARRAVRRRAANDLTKRLRTELPPMSGQLPGHGEYDPERARRVRQDTDCADEFGCAVRIFGESLATSVTSGCDAGEVWALLVQSLTRLHALAVAQGLTE